MLLDEITMPVFEAELGRTRVAVLPCGSVEEHGDHLPLGTDTYQVWEVARRAALRTPFFLCPPVHYGYCRSTADHPGTISIRPDTLRRLVRDLGCDLHRQGIRGLVIVSGHAGGIHMAALEEAGELLLQLCPDLEVAVVCEYRWAQEAGAAGIVDTRDDGHAGEIETSRLLALHPDLVTGTGRAETPNFEKPFLARDRRAVWPGGVWGDPTLATRSKGEALLEACTERMVSLVQAMATRIAGYRT